MDGELKKASTNYAIVLAKCQAMDTKIYQDAIKSGGANYAKLCIMAYRQSKFLCA